MIEKLHWLGHASFRFDGSKTIYFDPWKISKQAKKADIIFISHDHFDHFSLEDIKIISKEDTIVVTEKTVAKQIQGRVICKEVKVLSPQDTAEIDAVRVRAVPSYNIDKPFHPKESKRLGFIVEIDGLTIYHAGDTDYIPEMKDYRCDVALLPVSGTYVMTAEEAGEAVLAIRPKIAIPMHYGDIVGTDKDAKRFSELLKDKIEVRILNPEK